LLRDSKRIGGEGNTLLKEERKEKLCSNPSKVRQQKGSQKKLGGKKGGESEFQGTRDKGLRKGGVSSRGETFGGCPVLQIQS